ncbi:MAG: thermonuclease family protein, partial [Rubrobacter sp.]|nr:thermonuclease family protein [Rubrobacter sp.]
MLHSIVQWFRGLSGRAKVATTLGAALLLIICVFLSPLVVLGAGLVLLLALLVLVIQALRRRPLRTPAIIVGVSLLLVVVFSGISGAIYGTATEEAADRGAASSESSDPGSSEREPVPEPEPTQEQQAENTEQETSEEESTEEQASREDEQQSRDATEGEDRDEQENAAPAESDSQDGSSPDPAPEDEPRQSEESASSEPEPEREGSGLASRGQVVTVTRVVDGDTIEVSPAVDGIQDVRLIGVDTPETYGGEEPLGPQASAFATDALAGEEVALEFDEERVDPYDRALAYVWVSGGDMFNAQLLQEGLAQVATFPPNTRYVDRFESIQADARAAGIGIWGLSPAQQCELADRDNGIGKGSPGCASGSEPAPQPAPEPSPAPEPEPAPDPPQGGTASAPPVS